MARYTYMAIKMYIHVIEKFISARFVMKINPYNDKFEKQ